MEETPTTTPAVTTAVSTSVDVRMAIVVRVGPQRERISPVVRSVIESSQWVQEFHLTRAGPQGRLAKGFDQQALEDKGIRVVIHPDEFDLDLVGKDVFYLADMPGVAQMTPRAFTTLAQSIASTRHTKTRWSLRLIPYRQERGWSFWTAMVLMTCIVNWFRGLVSNLWRSQDGQNVCVSSLVHGDSKVFRQGDSMLGIFFLPRETEITLPLAESYIRMEKVGGSAAGFLFHAERQRNTRYSELLCIVLFIALSMLPWGTIAYSVWTQGFTAMTWFRIFLQLLLFWGFGTCFALLISRHIALPGVTAWVPLVPFMWPIWSILFFYGRFLSGDRAPVLN